MSSNKTILVQDFEDSRAFTAYTPEDYVRIMNDIILQATRMGGVTLEEAIQFSRKDGYIVFVVDSPKNCPDWANIPITQ